MWANDPELTPSADAGRSHTAPQIISPLEGALSPDLKKIGKDGPIEHTELTTERVTFKNLREAVEIGKNCFSNPIDRALLSATFTAYAAHLRILPEPVLKGLVKLELYELTRGSEGKALAINGLYRSVFKRDEFWLGWLGVTPECQGKGIGRDLVLNVEGRAKDLGAKIMKVYMTATNAPLLKFYERLGYSQDGEVRKTFEGEMRVLKKQL